MAPKVLISTNSRDATPVQIFTETCIDVDFPNPDLGKDKD